MDKPTKVEIIGSNSNSYDLFVYFGLKIYSLEVFFESRDEGLCLDLSQTDQAEWDDEVIRFVFSQQFSYLLPFLVLQDMDS